AAGESYGLEGNPVQSSKNLGGGGGGYTLGGATAPGAGAGHATAGEGFDNLLVNGSFETGSLAPWQTAGSGVAGVDAVNFGAADSVAVLGFNGGDNQSAVEVFQDVP